MKSCIKHHLELSHILCSKFTFSIKAVENDLLIFFCSKEQGKNCYILDIWNDYGNGIYMYCTCRPGWWRLRISKNIWFAFKQLYKLPIMYVSNESMSCKLLASRLWYYFCIYYKWQIMPSMAGVYTSATPVFKTS